MWNKLGEVPTFLEKSFYGYNRALGTSSHKYDRRTARCLDRKILLASGILFAICATTGYLLLHDKVNLGQIKKRITDRLEFSETPYW